MLSIRSFACTTHLHCSLAPLTHTAHSHRTLAPLTRTTHSFTCSALIASLARSARSLSLACGKVDNFFPFRTIVTSNISSISVFFFSFLSSKKRIFLNSTTFSPTIFWAPANSASSTGVSGCCCCCCCCRRRRGVLHIDVAVFVIAPVVVSSFRGWRLV